MNKRESNKRRCTTVEDDEIEKKVDKFLSKANELQRLCPEYACEMQSILRNIYVFLHHDYIHVDYLSSIFSNRDMIDSMSRFKYNLKDYDHTRNTILDSNSISVSMSISKFQNYRFSRNHIKSSISHLKRKREILEIVSKISAIRKEFSRGTTNTIKQKDIIPHELYSRTTRYLNNIDMCSCRGEKILLDKYSVNIAEKNKKGMIVISKYDRNISNSSSSSSILYTKKREQKIDSTIHTKCCVANCDLSKDLKRNLYSDWIKTLSSSSSSKKNSKSYSSHCSKTFSRNISLCKEKNRALLHELENKLDKYECQCHSNGKDKNIADEYRSYKTRCIKKGIIKHICFKRIYKRS